MFWNTSTALAHHCCTNVLCVWIQRSGFAVFLLSEILDASILNPKNEKSLIKRGHHLLTSSPLTLPCLTWNSLVPLVVKVTTAAHVGSGRQQHELLNKTEAALKSPAVVRNDENIPNLAWIYNYAKSKFESLYWNFSIPIQSPGRELLWIICRDCVYLWESVCVIFFLPVFFFLMQISDTS